MPVSLDHLENDRGLFEVALLKIKLFSSFSMASTVCPYLQKQGIAKAI